MKSFECWLVRRRNKGRHGKWSLSGIRSNWKAAQEKVETLQGMGFEAKRTKVRISEVG
jgi:hypothetical protein